MPQLTDPAPCSPLCTLLGDKLWPRFSGGKGRGPSRSSRRPVMYVLRFSIEPLKERADDC